MGMFKSKPGRAKYGNRKREVDGERFDSAAELRRWQELHLMAHVGEIQDLRRQVKYVLIPAQYVAGRCVERAWSYRADFVYVHRGQTIVEDVKGFPNDRWPLVRKMMLHVHGIRIVVVGGKKKVKA